MIDREVKIPLYASAGIPEAWIINLQERQIEIFTTPSPNGYSQIHIYRKGETIHHELVGKLDVNEIFIIAS
jgi:Uma2 family endonuclease